MEFESDFASDPLAEHVMHPTYNITKEKLGNMSKKSLKTELRNLLRANITVRTFTRLSFQPRPHRAHFLRLRLPQLAPWGQGRFLIQVLPGLKEAHPPAVV